jgi:hypothetical protein
MHRFATELRVSARSVSDNLYLRRLAGALMLVEVSAPVYYTACGVWAFRSGGSMLAALVGIVALVPAALVAPVAAVVADRARRERVMAASLVARAALLGALAAGIALDAAWVVLVCACLASICARVFYPAVAASLPGVTRSREELVSANAVVSGTEHVGSVVGPALAGAALVLMAPALVCVAAATGTLAAALAVARMDGPHAAGEAEEGAPTGRFRELTAGFACLAADSRTRARRGPRRPLRSSRRTRRGGDPACPRRSSGGHTRARRARGRARSGRHRGRRPGGRPRDDPCGGALSAFGGVLWSVPFIAVVLLGNPIAAAIGLAVAGVGNVLLDVAIYTHVQEASDGRVLARAVTSLQSLAVTAVGLGSLAAGIGLATLGTRPTLAGIGVVVMATVGGLVRREAHADRSPPRPAAAAR